MQEREEDPVGRDLPLISHPDRATNSERHFFGRSAVLVGTRRAVALNLFNRLEFLAFYLQALGNPVQALDERDETYGSHHLS